MLPGKFTKNAITVQLVGGLGNQLFQYFAGLSFSNKANCDLILDSSRIGSGRHNHGVSIESFALEATVQDRRKRLGEFKFIVERIILKLSKWSFISDLFKIRNSAGIGFDSELDSILVGSYVTGYFQSYRYFEFLPSPDKSELALKVLTPWIEEYVNLAQANDPIMVHVRRGDYALESQKFGLLHANYYARALSKLGDLGICGPIWIFSDDVELAKQELQHIVPAGTLWIQPPTESPATESLFLLSRAKVIVIANSTFSYFGARLGLATKTVLYPSKWFRGMPDPVELIPPSWIPVESAWRD